MGVSLTRVEVEAVSSRVTIFGRSTSSSNMGAGIVGVEGSDFTQERMR
jgi:hypothetical protein